MGCCVSTKHKVKYVEYDEVHTLPSIPQRTASWLILLKEGKLDTLSWIDIQRSLSAQRKIHLFIHIFEEGPNQTCRSDGYSFDYTTDRNFQIMSLQDVGKLFPLFYLLDLIKFMENIFVLFTSDRHVVVLPEHSHVHQLIDPYVDNGCFTMKTCIRGEHVECASNFYISNTNWYSLKSILNKL